MKMETPIISAQSTALKASEPKTVTLPKTIFPEKLIIQIDFSPRANRKKNISIKVSAKNVMGELIGEPLIFEKSEKDAKQSFDKKLALQPYKCSQIELVSDSDLSISLTVIESSLPVI